MIGDAIAWVLGIVSVAVLIAARQRRIRKREEYRSELIGTFSEDEKENRPE